MKIHCFVDLFVGWILLSTLVAGSILEEELQKHLFKNYNKHVRPSKRVDDVITVHFFLTLSQVISVAEKSEELTTSQYITLRWQDERLSWDPKNFKNILTLRLPSSIFWKPDIALSNNIDVDFDRNVPVNALLNHTGVVEWLPPAIYRSSCSIQVDYFPFDWQNCSLRFQSFTYRKNEIFLVSVYDKVVVDKEAYTDNGEWNVIHCPVKVNDDPDDPDYQDITLYLIMQRKPLFYIINIIFPCILISSLSVLVFYLPSGCSEKTNMSISVLLGLPVYLLLLAKRVPETSIGVPLIGAYLLFTMLTVTLSVIFSVVVINIHHRSPATSVMSSWMRILFIEFLPPLLYIKVPILPTIHIDDDEDSKAEEKASPKSKEGENPILYPHIEVLDFWNESKSNNTWSTEVNTGEKRLLTKSILKKGQRKRKMWSEMRNHSRTVKSSYDSDFRKTELPGHEDLLNKASECERSARSDQSRRRVYVPSCSEISLLEEPSFIERKTRDIKSFPTFKDKECNFINMNDISGKFQSEDELSSSNLSLSVEPAAKRREVDGKDGDADGLSSNVYFKLSCYETEGKECGMDRSIFPSSQISLSYFDINHVSRESTSYQVHSYDLDPKSSHNYQLDSTPKQKASGPSTFHFSEPTQSRLRKRKLQRRSGHSVRNEALFEAKSPLHSMQTMGNASSQSHSVHFENSVREKQENKECYNNQRNEYPLVREVIHRFPSEASGCLKAVNFICQHVMDQNNNKAKAGEWKVVAMVLDRLLFWIFLLVYITGSLYFAIQALTNFPPSHPFVAGDPKYAKCWDGPSDQYLQSKFSWNG